jgi:uncharacterized membrane protein required for colicin V production
VDLVTFLSELNAADIVLLLLLAGSFLLGFFQGLVRQLLSLVGWFFAFTFAANLKGWFGGWLSQYWTHLQPTYSEMVAFGVIFVVLLVVAQILIQVAYKRTPIFARMSFVDEVLGGTLAVGLAVLLLASFVVVLNTHYGGVGSSGANEVEWISAVYAGLNDSAVVGALRGALIPGMLAVFGPFIPSDVQSATV